LGDFVESSDIAKLLTEIRDAQRRLADEYQRVANESLQLQKQAIEIQRMAVEQQSTAVSAQLKHGRLYRAVVVVGAIVMVGLIYFLYRIPI
jgi:hypothetical protein